MFKPTPKIGCSEITLIAIFQLEILRVNGFFVERVSSLKEKIIEIIEIEIISRTMKIFKSFSPIIKRKINNPPNSPTIPPKDFVNIIKIKEREDKEKYKIFLNFFLSIKPIPRDRIEIIER